MVRRRNRGLPSHVKGSRRKWSKRLSLSLFVYVAMFLFFFFSFCFFPMGNSSAAVLADGAGASTARASYKATPWKALL